VHHAILDALAVLLPVDCAGCGTADRAVCVACLGALDGPPIESRTPAGLLVRSAMPYLGTARGLILALKEHDRTDVAKPLAQHLAPLLPPALPLVAVPPSPAAWRRRGYDPVRLLVRRPTLRVLRVARATEVQKSLSVDERAANRTGFLRATRSLHGLRVAIVDDVVTTGATVDEAVRAIQSAGGEVDHAITLAATPLKFERRTRTGWELSGIP
jgi:predicted amidophosphoribosyltransferase